jgi:3-hydroxymyristoyl/3-hydroxydecanoyl-(acyl carrier protein) dehydratase
MTASPFIVALPFASDHPAFAGHFPGRPIIPGVQLLDRAQRLIETRHGMELQGLKVAKFLNPAGPGAVLELEYRIARDLVHFEIRCGERRIAQGQFVAAAPS